MHPPRFYHHNNYIPHHNQWRPHGPRFGQTQPMQYNNNQNGQIYTNLNEEHWCETCDRGFRTLELLSSHKQQHQKCNIDGCQFIAHPKVITKHIQMQHSTGLYKKIAKLDNPEEIQKWREERKKRYPTKENIEKKSTEIKEKIDRGEKMGMRNQFNNRNKDRNNINGREQGMKRKWSQDMNRKNVKRRFQSNRSFTEMNDKAVENSDKKPKEPNKNKKTVPLQKEKKIIPVVNDSKTLKPFTGILNLLDEIDETIDDVEDDMKISDSIEDDEYNVMDEVNDKIISNNTEPVVCGALSSLMCNYQSSDEETTQDSTQMQVNKCESLIVKNNFTEQTAAAKPLDCPKSPVDIQNNTENIDDDSGPEEVEIVKTNDNIVRNTDVQISQNGDACKSESKKTKAADKLEKHSRTSQTRNLQKKFKRKLPSTLLEKLLQNEIRQERNIVLQCIRYIIKNNYFEK